MNKIVIEFEGAIPLPGLPGIVMQDAPWASGIRYRRNDGLAHNGSSWRVLVEHIAAAENEPGVGEDWQAFWAPLAQGLDADPAAVAAVASVKTEMAEVAGKLGAVEAVAGRVAEVQIVAGVASQIQVVAEQEAPIRSVADEIDAVRDAALNLDAIKAAPAAAESARAGAKVATDQAAQLSGALNDIAKKAPIQDPNLRGDIKLSAQMNSTVEGLIELSRPDTSRRASRIRYKNGSAVASANYVAFDVHSGVTPADPADTTSGFTEVMRLFGDGTVQFAKPPALSASATYSYRAAAAAERISAIVQEMYLLGFASAYDGGAGRYRRVATAAPNNGGFRSADGAYWELVMERGGVNIAQFGARPDDGTIASDCQPAFQNAILFVSARGGGDVRIPAGSFRKATGTLSLRDGVSIRGESMRKSVIILDDLSPGAAVSALFNTSAGVSDVAFSDFAIIGMLDQSLPNVSTGGQAFRIVGGNSKNISVDRLFISKVRAFCITIQDAENVWVRDCHLFHNSGDSIASWRSSNVNILDNLIVMSEEDSISVHNDGSTSIRGKIGAIIARNTIIEAPGPHCHGAGIIIANNVMIRARVHGVFLSANGLEADLNVVACQITGNVVTDLWDKPALPNGQPTTSSAGYIVLGSTPRRSALSEYLGSPGRPSKALDGTVVGDFGTPADGGGRGLEYVAAGTDEAPNASTGGIGVVVSGNVLTRTLADAMESVTRYSQDPRGFWLNNDGVDIGPWYTGPSTIQTPVPGIVVFPGLRRVRISDNVIRVNAAYGIVMKLRNSTVSPDLYPMTWDGVTIESNDISEFTLAGVAILPGGGIGGKPQDIRLKGNVFDGDPRCVSVGRKAGGKWAAGATLAAVDLGTTTGVRVDDNEIRNVAMPIAGTPLAKARNRLLCDPVGVGGFNADNRGIGDCPAPAAGFEYVILNSDPTSAAYGQPGAPAPISAKAMPASGKFVQGHFVANELQSVADGKIHRGWLRLTTGTAHVAGADWTPIYDLVA